MQSNFQARKATRQKAKIRLHLSAPSGGGKTYSAILIAQGLADGDLTKVGIIDTENRSADLYEHLGEFNVIPFDPPYSPERYIEAIEYAESQGYEVIIIDSITHEWDGEGGILRIADKMTGDNFSKWKTLTPRHDAFIHKILTSRCHIITTVRRKQEYALVDGENGRKKVEKLGLKEVTREGIDYEMTTVLELDINHNAVATKDRTGLFMDKPQFTPGVHTGRAIAEWCENGVDIATQVKEAIAKLSKCDSREEVQLLGETLPTVISTNQEFRAAATARWAALKVPAPETAHQPAGSQPRQTQISPYKCKYESVDELAGLLPGITDVKDLANLNYINAEMVEANPDLKKKFLAKKSELYKAPAADQPAEEQEAESDPFKTKYENLDQVGAQLPKATTVDEVSSLYYANQDLIEAMPTFKAVFTARRQEIEGKKPATGTGGIKPLEGNGQADADAAVTAAIEGAETRNALLTVYKEHKATIDTHDGLKKAYDTRLNTFPKPGPKPKGDEPAAAKENANTVADQRTEEWFKDRIGKHIWMQSADPAQYTGSYLVEHADVPGWLVGWQNSNGFTYRDLTEDEQATTAAAQSDSTTAAATDGQTGTTSTGADGQDDSTASGTSPAGAEALETGG